MARPKFAGGHRPKPPEGRYKLEGRVSIPTKPRGRPKVTPEERLARFGEKRGFLTDEQRAMGRKARWEKARLAKEEKKKAAAQLNALSDEESVALLISMKGGRAKLVEHAYKILDDEGAPAAAKVNALKLLFQYDIGRPPQAPKKLGDGKGLKVVLKSYDGKIVTADTEDESQEKIIDEVPNQPVPDYELPELEPSEVASGAEEAGRQGSEEVQPQQGQREEQAL